MTQSRGKNKARYAISKLLKTKDKSLEDNQRNMTSYLRRNEDENYNRLIRNHKKMKWHFKVLKKKKTCQFIILSPKKKSLSKMNETYFIKLKKKGTLVVKHLYLKKDQRKS